jgi:hypothetical protein
MIARLASAAPTVAGSRAPTVSWPSVRARNHAAERDRGGERAPVGQLLAGAVGHREGAPMLPRDAHELGVQRVARRTAVADGFGAEVLNGLTHVGRG